MKVMEWWVYNDTKCIQRLCKLGVLQLLREDDQPKALKKLGGNQIVNVIKEGNFNGLGN